MQREHRLQSLGQFAFNRHASADLTRREGRQRVGEFAAARLRFGNARVGAFALQLEPRLLHIRARNIETRALERALDAIEHRDVGLPARKIALLRRCPSIGQWPIAQQRVAGCKRFVANLGVGAIALDRAIGVNAGELFDCGGFLGKTRTRTHLLQLIADGLQAHARGMIVERALNLGKLAEQREPLCVPLHRKRGFAHQHRGKFWRQLFRTR